MNRSPKASKPPSKPAREPERPKAPPKPIRQHNNAQEVTGGGLPDPHRAAAFDQDEG
jgi:hypothetical protein